MVRQFSPRTFFRQTPNHILQQYFKRKDIPTEIEWEGLGETDVEPIFEAMDGLDDHVRQEVEGDFVAVNELACSKGVLAILEEAQLWGRDWSDQFAEMKNAYERAFWTFLNEPHRFAAAGNLQLLDRLGSWKRRMVGVMLEPKTTPEDLERFESSLRSFYAKQGRGRFCHVDYYERTNPERHCFFAYPEDFANAELGYDDSGKFQHRIHRSAFENIFVYRPEDGFLEVHAKGGKKVVEPLMEIFCTTILGLKAMPEDGRMPFDLTSLKDRSFNFTIEPKDGIASIDLLELKLDIAGNGSGCQRGQVTLGVPARNNENLHNLIDEVIDTKNARLSDLHPAKAKLRVAFKPVNGYQAKTLPFTLTYPDGCTLKDDPHDQVVKDVLRRSGIAL